MRSLAFYLYCHILGRPRVAEQCNNGVDDCIYPGCDMWCEGCVSWIMWFTSSVAQIVQWATRPPDYYGLCLQQLSTDFRHWCCPHLPACLGSSFLLVPGFARIDVTAASVIAAWWVAVIISTPGRFGHVAYFAEFVIKWTMSAHAHHVLWFLSSLSYLW